MTARAGLSLIADVDARVAGYSVSRALAGRHFARITIDFTSLPAALALGAAPLIDALSALFSPVTIDVRAADWIRILWEGHWGATAPAPAAASRACSPELYVRVEPEAPGGVTGREERSAAGLIIVRVPADVRRAGWSSAIWRAGLEPCPPRAHVLRTTRAARRRGRRWLRGSRAKASGPLVVVTHQGESVAQGSVLDMVMSLWMAEMKLTPLLPSGVVHRGWPALPALDDPELCAGILSHAAVAVGAESDLTHLASAMGIPVVELGSAIGPGHIYETLAACERFAASRWPWDRLARALP